MKLVLSIPPQSQSPDDFKTVKDVVDQAMETEPIDVENFIRKLVKRSWKISKEALNEKSLLSVKLKHQKIQKVELTDASLISMETKDRCLLAKAR